MPVVIIHIASLGIGQLKLNIRQRGLGDLIQLPDHESADLGVLKNQAVGALLDLDNLGRGILDIAFRRLLLRDDQDLSRLEAGDHDEAVAVGGIAAIVRPDSAAILVRDQENSAGQGILLRILFQNRQ